MVTPNVCSLLNTFVLLCLLFTLPSVRLQDDVEVDSVCFGQNDTDAIDEFCSTKDLLPRSSNATADLDELKLQRPWLAACDESMAFIYVGYVIEAMMLKLRGNVTVKTIDFKNFTHIRKASKSLRKSTQYERSSNSADGHRSSGALSVAIEHINNRTDLLPGYCLDFKSIKTNGREFQSVAATMKLWEEGVSAFIGYEGTCRVQAMMAASNNIPIISHKCPDTAVSDKESYPTFARTVPSGKEIVLSVIALLKQFKWSQFMILYGNESKYVDLADRLEREVKLLDGFGESAVLDMRKFPEPHLGHRTRHRESMKELVRATKHLTRSVQPVLKGIKM